jgi:hypothetical protein
VRPVYEKRLVDLQSRAIRKTAHEHESREEDIMKQDRPNIVFILGDNVGLVHMVGIGFKGKGEVL